MHEQVGRHRRRQRAAQRWGGVRGSRRSDKQCPLRCFHGLPCISTVTNLDVRGTAPEGHVQPFTLVPLAFAFLGLVRKIKLRVDAGEEVGLRPVLDRWDPYMKIESLGGMKN